jgi:rRNA maturation endonuclease Nob1
MGDAAREEEGARRRLMPVWCAMCSEIVMDDDAGECPDCGALLEVTIEEDYGW